MVTKEEKIDMVREAQAKLFEAIETLKFLFGEDGYVKAYLIDHLEIMASSGHGFLSRDLNLDNLIERIESDDETADKPADEEDEL